MSSEERILPPSDHRLEQLRKSGVVPSSPLLLASVAIVSLPVALFAVQAAIGARLLTAFGSLERVSGTMTPGDEGIARALNADVGELGLLLATGMLVGLAVCAGIVGLVGAIQNRFLVTTAPLLFDFSRLFSWSRFSGVRSRLLVSVIRVLLVGAVIMIGRSLILEFAQPVTQAYWGITSTWQLHGGLNSIEEDGAQSAVVHSAREVLEVGLAHYRRAATSMLLPLLVGLVVVGVCGRVFAGLFYLRSHRMSQAEAEAEARETEPAPELLQARQRRYSEGPRADD